ncbi:hypothetical protein CHS0354_012590 [Potamilus streckersoni]|uniref:SRCR domain-containing protein n=1 Tax=Potamilus streckersoni TaxID=2493646 RepID=A0AAE0SY70_9BIVA|nr:hypothetical protein CHS0354_012590 [Potamilus streckersoni]
MQELFVMLLLLQTIHASLTQFNKDRRSPNIHNIRLAGVGATQFMGRIEILGPNGTWGTICDDSFDINDATVVCRVLGFSSKYVSAYERAHFGKGSGPVWLDGLECNGNETGLEQCISRGWGRNDCGHDEDASVACGFLVQNIRLAGNGSTNSRGRVEVLSPNGMGATICGSEFDPLDAKVICRMLGFNNGSGIAYYSDFFGAGYGPVWIYILGSRGNETHLDQCPSTSKETTRYQYSNAGVRCGVAAQVFLKRDYKHV